MTQLRKHILKLVEPDLSAIEEAIREHLRPEVDFVSKVAGHILFSGGKRLRPLLMVLCARLCGYDRPFAVSFSTIFEYLHVATLLHDDLVDGALLRRGKPAAHTVWSPETAVLTGDYLLARALSIAAEAGDIRIIRAIGHITENMAQGEIHQIQRKRDTTLSETEYEEVIRRKTAVLFQGACRISALLADAPEERVVALSAYGFHLGMAFQMIDDLIDYTQDFPKSGKRAGADIREGKMTLPLIHALSLASKEERQWIESLVRNPEFSDETMQRLLRLLEKHDAFTYTRNRAVAHVEEAKRRLEIFEPSESRAILELVSEYCLQRES
jgi:octaprenyl-diphosphate synthase